MMGKTEFYSNIALRRFCRVASVLLMLTCLILAHPVHSFAGVARDVDRNDKDFIEEAMINLQAQKHILIDQIVASTKLLDAVQQIEDVYKQYEELKKGLTEFSGQIKQLDMMGEFQSKIDDAANKFSEISGSIGQIKDSGSFFDSIFSTIDTSATAGLGGIINTGNNTEAPSAGRSGNLSAIADKDGLIIAAQTAVKRGSQGAEEIGKKATAAAGGTVEKAVAEAYKWLVSTVPMMFKDTFSAQASSSSAIDFYEEQTKDDYYVYLADAAKTVPSSAVTSILSKYIDDESPYSAKQKAEDLKKETEKITEELKSVAQERSANSATAKTAAILVRQNEQLSRQWSDIIDAGADSIKLSAITAAIANTASAREFSDRMAGNTAAVRRLVILNPEQGNKYLGDVLSTGVQQ